MNSKRFGIETYLCRKNADLFCLQWEKFCSKSLRYSYNKNQICASLLHVKHFVGCLMIIVKFRIDYSSGKDWEVFWLLKTKI